MKTSPPALRVAARALLGAAGLAGLCLASTWDAAGQARGQSSRPAEDRTSSALDAGPGVAPIRGSSSSGGGETVFDLEAEAGYQHLDGDATAAKLREYRDHPDDTALPRLSLRVRRWDIDFRLEAVDAGEDDAVYRLSADKPGLFGLKVGWDELPHALADRTVTLHRLSNRSELLVPDRIQQELELFPFRLQDFLRTDTMRVGLATRRETARGSASLSPVRGLTLEIEGEDEKRRGRIPRSVSTNFLNGADVTEWASPIDHETRRVRLAAEYVIGPAALAASASVTRFDDLAGRLLVDNPLRATDAEGLAFGNRSAEQFLVSVAPDNEAREVAVRGSVALPWRIRAGGTLARGKVEAEVPMLPFTSNSAVRANFFYPSLPASTIDGEVRTKRYDAFLSGNPLRPITFRLYARGYEYDNRTPSYRFDGYVIADTRLALLARRSLPYGWERAGGGADLTYRPHRFLALGAGYDRQNVDRTFREIERTEEETVRASVDWRGADWVALRGSWLQAERVGTPYDPDAYRAGYPSGLPREFERMALLRRFDLADRDRRVADIDVVLEIVKGWQIDVASRDRRDEYSQSLYGLVDDETRSNHFGTSFPPFHPCSFRGEVGQELSTRRVNARFRPVFMGFPGDTRRNDWSDELTEKVHFLQATLTCREEEEGWSLEVHSRSISDRQTHDAASNPAGILDPLGEGDARSYPPTKRQLKATAMEGRFRLGRHLELILRAAFERYEQGDPLTDLMRPAMAPVDGAAFESAYLGARVRSYSTSIYGAFLGGSW